MSGAAKGTIGQAPSFEQRRDEQSAGGTGGWRDYPPDSVAYIDIP